MKPTHFIVAALAFVGLVACSSPRGEEASQQADTSALSKTISSSYGITTFGGPGDYQPMACGQNSRTANQWYVASSQRYGCHQHLKIVASNGKCVVVSTEDAGPATYVETRAGMPVLDSSPAVGRYLFGESDLGWSDIKSNPSKYRVSAERTTLPVGPCGASSAPDPSSSSSSSSSGDDPPTPPPDDTSSSSSSSSSSGGVACSSDGECNPGNDGSGLTCVDGQCVPGCTEDWYCPGATVCVDGECI